MTASAGPALRTQMPVLVQGDARHLPLPDASVDLIVTSPPYFGMRDYRDLPGSMAGQIAEATPREFLDARLRLPVSVPFEGGGRARCLTCGPPCSCGRRWAELFGSTWRNRCEPGRGRPDAPRPRAAQRLLAGLNGLLA
jgi:hypothetical protein